MKKRKQNQPNNKKGKVVQKTTTTEKIKINFGNLRLRDNGKELILQYLKNGLYEYPVSKEVVKKIFSKHPMPEFLWEVLSNESIAAIYNDYLLNNEERCIMIPQEWKTEKGCRQ